MTPQPKPQMIGPQPPPAVKFNSPEMGLLLKALGFDPSDGVREFTLHAAEGGDLTCTVVRNAHPPETGIVTQTDPVVQVIRRCLMYVPKDRVHVSPEMLAAALKINQQGAPSPPAGPTRG